MLLKLEIHMQKKKYMINIMKNLIEKEKKKKKGKKEKKKQKN